MRVRMRLLCLVPAWGLAWAAPLPAEVTGPAASCRVAFSPRGDGLDMILDELKSARTRVDAALFYLSNDTLVDALVYLAARTPVQVRLLLDGAMARAAHRQTLNRLRAAGAEIYIEDFEGRGKLHLKTCVVDGRTVLTGSSNWTQDAFAENCEDSVMIRSPRIATFYLDAFDSVQARCVAYEGESARDLAIPSSFPKAAKYTRNRKDERPVAPRRRNFNDVRQSEVYVTPGREGVDRLIALVGAATRRVDVGIYSLSDPAVIEALAALARARPSVKIRVLADDTMLSGTRLAHLQALHDAGIPVYTMDDHSASMHLKNAVIDEQVVVTGSHNWTPSAANANVEDMVFLVSRRLAQYYQAYHGYLVDTHATAYAEVERDAAADGRNRSLAPAGLRRAGEVRFPSTLPATGPRKRFSGLDEKPEAPAFAVEGAIEYVDDGEYLPLLLDLVATARQSILVSMYHVPAGPRAASLEEVLDALGDAAGRGVYVYMVLNMPPNPSDSQHEKHSALAERLRQRGVDVRLNVPALSLHEKVVVVDLAKILIGSHNWSEGALTGDAVYESGAFIVLPRQDPRWAQRILKHEIVRDMRSRERWESELALLRHIDALGGDERAAYVRELEAGAP